MRRSARIFLAATLATALPLASCGSDASKSDTASLAGSWRETNLALPGTGAEMTLLVDSAGAVAGTGVSHVEAGQDQPFTVSGTVQDLDWHYTDASLGTRSFAVVQPDRDHLQLTNAQAVNTFVREQ